MTKVKAEFLNKSPEVVESSLIDLVEPVLSTLLLCLEFKHVVVEIAQRRY